MVVFSLDRWVGKIAVVTGVSSGIGVAIVEKLVEEGVIVIGIARRVELVEKKAQELSNKKGILHAYKADVSKKEEVIEAFNWVVSKHGPISILINNAGTARDTTLVDGNVEDWKAVLDLNVFGLCVATREAISSMRENNINGHIIHINSWAGHVVPNVPQFNVYPASKFAVTALTETLRQELSQLKSKIKVTSISPGLVVSELTTLKPNLNPQVKAMLNEFPILQAEDVANSIIYALSTPEHIHDLIIKPVGEKF